MCEENEDGCRHPAKLILDNSRFVHREIERRMAALSLSSIQSRMLGYLYFQMMHGCPVFQRDLEKEFRIRKSSVTSVVQGLEKRGLLEHSGVPGDARLKELSLTRQGIQMQETVIAQLDAVEAMINSALSLEERQVFIDCMRKIEAKLKEAEND